MADGDPVGYVCTVTGGSHAAVWHPYRDCPRLSNTDVHEYSVRSLVKTKRMCKECAGESTNRETERDWGPYRSLVQAAGDD